MTICKKETAFLIFRKFRRSIHPLKWNFITFAAFPGSMSTSMAKEALEKVNHRTMKIFACHNLEELLCPIVLIYLFWLKCFYLKSNKQTDYHNGYHHNNAKAASKQLTSFHVNVAFVSWEVLQSGTKTLRGISVVLFSHFLPPCLEGLELPYCICNEFCKWNKNSIKFQLSAI